MVHNNLYDKKIDEILKKHIESTSAEGTIKGFLYQFLITLNKWIEMYREGKFYEIYPEYCDDIHIKLKNKTQYIQVKGYDSTNITLNNKAFIKSIKNFFYLYRDNKEKQNVQFIFHTNSKVGDKSTLIKKWIKGEVSNLEKKEIYEQIKVNLNNDIDKDLKENENNINDTIKEELNSKWLQFISLIKLIFEGETVDKSKKKLESNILNNIKLINCKYKCENIFYRLLVEVMEKSINVKSKNKKLDNKLLNSILNDSEECMIMNIEKKLLDIEENINEQCDRIYDNTEKIINGAKNNTEKIINGVENSTEKIINVVQNNQHNKEEIIDICISSRNELKDKRYTLDLTEFFKYGEGYNCYKYIKSSDIWNNELLKKINSFFDNLIKEQNNEKYSILFDGIHYSIAFYIGYKYGKALKNPYLKRESELYKFHAIHTDTNYKIYDDKTLLPNTEDVVVIVNTTRDPDIIKNQVKDFINKNNIKTFSILNLTLGEKNDNFSINKNNFYYIACQMAKLIQKYVNKDQTIHLFSITTVEETFAIGRLLFDMKNIILYEHVGEDKIYIPTVRL